jgi:hypothetical protein
MQFKCGRSAGFRACAKNAVGVSSSVFSGIFEDEDEDE